MTVRSDQGLLASLGSGRQGMSVLQVMDYYMVKKAVLHDTL